MKKLSRLLIWLLGIIALLIGAVYLSAYLMVEYYLLSSYRNTAMGLHKEAAVNSTLALQLAQNLYPATSKHYQDIFLYDLKLWSKQGIMGASFTLPGLRNFTVAKTQEFEKRNKNELSYEEMARIKIESARIANATTHGDGVSLVLEIARKPSLPNELLTANAKEEVAFRYLTGVFSTLSPKDEEQRKQNKLIADAASKDHGAAQVNICRADNYQCRFNDLRWNVGVCIRRAYLKEVPVCDSETLFAVTNFVGLACKDLSSNQCYEIVDGLLPYYYQLLQAQGKGFEGVLKFQTKADEIPRDLTFTHEGK